jgi:flagellar basal-body rod protein FlgB
MINNIFSDIGFTSAKKALDSSSLRQKVIANNVANVNTPGFKRSDVTFEGKLQAALGDENNLQLTNTDPKHFSTSTAGVSSMQDVNPEVATDNSTSTRQDENNVDIDTEMANLAENAITYQTFTKLLGAKFRSLSSAISEGKR